MIKKYGFLVIAAALVLPLVAHGKLTIPNDALGMLDASLDVCSWADPQSAQKFREAKSAILQGATEDEIKAARDSQEYKDRYNSTKKELEKKPKAELAKSCAAAVQKKN